MTNQQIERYDTFIKELKELCKKHKVVLNSYNGIEVWEADNEKVFKFNSQLKNCLFDETD